MTEKILIITTTRNRELTEFTRSIHNKYDDVTIIIYALGAKRRYFKNQLKTIDYENCIYDIDIKSEDNRNKDQISLLREFEDSLDGEHTLNDCIYIDRKLSKDGQVGIFNDERSYFGQEEMLHFISKRLYLLRNLLIDSNIKYIFTYMAHRAPSLIAYLISERESIPFFRCHRGRIKDYTLVYDNLYEYSPIIWGEQQRILEDKKNTPEFKHARDHLNNVRSGEDLYSITTKDPRTLFDRFLHVGEVLWWEKAGLVRKYYYDTPKMKYFYKKSLKKIRGKILEKNTSVQSEIPDKSFIYFPLQAQPDKTLMMWEKHYTNQKELAKQVSRSLPIDSTLVVNDHPIQQGARSLRYYSELNSQYNIDFIDSVLETNKVIKKSDVVFTITSTVGFEALIHGTPVITVGRPKHAPFYTNFDFVQTVDNPYQIHDAIMTAKNIQIDEEKLAAYVAAVMKIGTRQSNSDYHKGILNQIDRYISDQYEK
jgi:capsule polysaccharide modification protein KpsS